MNCEALCQNVLARASSKLTPSHNFASPLPISNRPDDASAEVVTDAAENPETFLAVSSVGNMNMPLRPDKGQVRKNKW